MSYYPPKCWDRLLEHTGLSDYDTSFPDQLPHLIDTKTTPAP